jgi:xylulokinase
MDAQGLYVIPKTCSPKTVVYGPTQSSGASVAWIAKLFDISIDEVLERAQNANIGIIPIYLPYISGERAPIWRTDIKGSFNLVDALATQSEFLAATLEGISFHERSVLDAAAAALNRSFNSVTLGGHAGNDPRWDGIRLRTLGVDLERKTDIDSTTRGAAMLAMALGGSDLGTAVQSLRPDSQLSTPNADEITYSGSKYQDFVELRRNLLRFHDSRL